MGNKTGVKIILLFNYPIKPDENGNYYKNFFIILFFIGDYL